MKISSKKIVPEDFSSEERSYTKKLASILNPFIEQVTKILTNNVSFQDNARCKIIKFSMDAGVLTALPSWDFAEKPNAVFVGSIQAAGTHIAETYSMSWIFSFDSNQKSILNVSFVGLDANKKHDITLIAIV